MDSYSFKISLVIAAHVLSASAFSSETINDAFKETKLENFSESTCPSKNFQDFFKKFSEDRSIQNKYTYPLVTTTWITVDDVPEPTPFIETLPKAKLEFPLIPNIKERKEKNLYFKNIDSDSYSALLAGENSGYNIRYIFIRTSCWYLIGIEDFSI